MKRLVCYLSLFTLFCGFNALALASNNSTSQLINQALERREIDSETALVYQVLNVAVPGLLPTALRPASEEFEKCATLIMLEIAAAWPELSDAARSTLEPYLITAPQLIPKDPNQRQKSVYQASLPNSYQTTNFNIEWGNTIPGISEWQDTSPANGRPDYIDNLATYLEDSWTEAVTTKQLQVPSQSSTYLVNIYVANTDDGAPSLSGSIYGYATVFPYDSGVTGPTGMAYIVMNNDYSRFPTNSDPEGSFLGAMKVTVAHEFFHNIQFAYDINEAAWIMEMSATWMEDEVFDVVNDYYNYVSGSSGWQMYPETSLAYFNGMHEYGNVIFAKYLSETYPAVNIMKELWELLDDTGGDNALSALGTFFGNQSPATTLTNAFNDFTAKNVTMDYSEGANYGGYGASDKIFHQEAISTFPVTRNLLKSYTTSLPDYLGSNYVKLTNSAAAITLQISFNGDSTFNSRSITWGAAAVAVKAAGGYDVFEFTLDTNGDGIKSVSSLGTGGTYDKVYLVARVLSPTGVTPTESSGIPYSSYPNGVPYTFTASLGSISVSPTTATVVIGETQQFTASGGTTPYNWSTSDTEVGSIDSAGLFTAVGGGSCTILVSDAGSEGGLSGTISVAGITADTRPEERDISTSQRLCFIATAAYGSPLAEEVGVLCLFRDRYLLTNRPGRWFIDTYYRLSPPAASFISQHPSLKQAVRILLIPIIYFVVFLLYPGWMFKILFCLALVTLTAAGLRKMTTYTVN